MTTFTTGTKISNTQTRNALSKLNNPTNFREYYTVLNKLNQIEKSSHDMMRDEIENIRKQVKANKPTKR
jgi:hypothetical protein